MAELLKRQSDIVTMKVELGSGRRVSFTLQFHEQHEFRSEPLWQGVLADLGLAAATESQWKPPPEHTLHLPKNLLKALQRGWRAHGQGQPCLWVHLVQPYGLLRFLPWERLLAVLAVPVLMLPDFIFPPPRESFSLLDVVICGSSPLDSETAEMRNGLLDAVAAINNSVDRPVRLHLFTDVDLSPQVSSNHFAHQIIVHRLKPDNLDTAAGTDAALQRNSTLRSPWLLWMGEALKSYSVDVVHFVCHGYLSGTHGALLFAQSPLGRTDNFMSAPVGAIELKSFMTQIGAWATIFSAPADNHDMLGLRALADEIAQMLPGPMMMFDPSRADNEVLQDGYRFIFSPTHQEPPQNRDALYLYCQPYLLTRGKEHEQDSNDAVRRRIVSYSRNTAQLDSAYSTYSRHLWPRWPNERGGESISAVSAATERLSEQVELHYQKLLRDDVVPVTIAQEDRSIAMDTIDRFRQAVEEIEQHRLKSEVDELLHEIEGNPVVRDPLPESQIKQRLLNKIKQYVTLGDYQRQAAQLFAPSNRWAEGLHARIRNVEAHLVSEVSQARHISVELAASYLDKKVKQVMDESSTTQVQTLGAEEVRKER